MVILSYVIYGDLFSAMARDNVDYYLDLKSSENTFTHSLFSVAQSFYLEHNDNILYSILQNG